MGMSLEKVALDAGFKVSRRLRAVGLRCRATDCKEEVIVIRYRGWFHIERSPTSGERFFVAVNEKGGRLCERLAYLVNPQNVKYDGWKACWELELVRHIGGYIVTIRRIPTF